jgi:hypothetical protein
MACTCGDDVTTGHRSEAPGPFAAELGYAEAARAEDGVDPPGDRLFMA